MQATSLFISARFRSGSTLLWNIFRHFPNCVAYYEPCHHSLLQQIQMNTQASASHRNVTSYWDEYFPIHEELRKRHKAEFGAYRLLLEKQDEYPELEAYLGMLLASVPGRLPVLQCNRVDFRLPWLRARFPSTPILHLSRNSRDIWASMVRGKPTGAWKNPLLNTQYDLVVWSLSMAHQLPVLFAPEVETSYHRHYLLWRLAELMGQRQADAVIDFDTELVADPEGAVKKLADFVGCADIDAKDLAKLIVQPSVGGWRSLAPESWFDHAEEVCDGLLDSLGLLEHFGAIPLAAIESARPDAWSEARHKAGAPVAEASALIATAFRKETMDLGVRHTTYRQNARNVLQAQKAEIQRLETRFLPRLFKFLERHVRNAAPEPGNQ